MTDYLEEHLGNVEALLEQVRKLEQSASGLPPRSTLEENTDNFEEVDKKEDNSEEKSEVVSQRVYTVYNKEKEVNYIKDMVDIMGFGTEKGENDIINQYKVKDDNSRDQDQTARASKGTGQGVQTGLGRTENHSPVSDQLEELDRAVSTLTALAPERREAASGGWPVSLPSSRGLTADPVIAGIPDGGWSGPDAAARVASAYGGMRSWAEQADLAFRRDSRRYDGGFTLY